MTNLDFKYEEKLTADRREQVLKLWNKEYPQQLSYKEIQDFDAYLSKLDDKQHLLAIMDDYLCGWMMCFTRNTERWFAMIVDRSYQGMTIGTRLMKLAKQKESVLNGWVIDNSTYLRADETPYVSPLSFYLKNGFIALPNTRLELPHLSALKITWKKPITI
ncbi:MAG: GNAT family N-acetyltransferase [Bacteroidia bacterium]|nr:GNAT family N-acetyltransferase [Bacteroidia bacterium]